jgi:hypothetical protein
MIGKVYRLLSAQRQFKAARDVQRMSGDAHDPRLRLSLNDDDVVRGYCYFLSSAPMNVVVEADEALKGIHAATVLNFSKAEEWAAAHPDVAHHLNGGWLDNAKAFKANLTALGDAGIMDFGARSYKTLNRIERAFDEIHFGHVVKETSVIFDHIWENYGQPDGFRLTGYTKLRYPHFMYRGKALNNAGQLSNMESLLFLDDRIGLDSLKIVAEIGAGDGLFMAQLIENWPGRKGIIFDLPEIAVRSTMLISAHTDRVVGGMALYEECGRSAAKALEKCDILVLPCWEAENLDVGIDLWVNKHSFGEMSKETAVEYVNIIRRSGGRLFSINRARPFFNGIFNEIVVDTYLGPDSGMVCEFADYPISSNVFEIRPSYARQLFRPRTEN